MDVLVKAPRGRGGILLQLLDELDRVAEPADARRVAQDLIELADELARMQNLMHVQIEAPETEA